MERYKQFLPSNIITPTKFDIAEVNETLQDDAYGLPNRKNNLDEKKSFLSDLLQEKLKLQKLNFQKTEFDILTG